MFSRSKATPDVKKSTLKFLDVKKDAGTRLKHLKLILDSVDISEAKALFATNYSHIYHLVYEGIIAAEASLKTRGVHRAQREELEGVLQLFEKVLVLLPDLLHCRWQLHSISRLMAKLNHPSNATSLRKSGLRLFLMWYQALGLAAPAYIHSMFAALVPGLPGAEGWPPPPDSTNSGLGAGPYEITPVLPAASTSASDPNSKGPEEGSAFFLELLLDFMVSQAPKLQWNDGAVMWGRSIEFCYERFKEYYLPRIFADFTVTTDIYKPVIELPEPRKSGDMSIGVTTACQVVFVKWIANYAHSVYRSMDYSLPSQLCHSGGWNSAGSTSTSINPAGGGGDEVPRGGGASASTPPSSLGDRDRDSLTSYSSINNKYEVDVDANVIAKDVILGSRANINFLHEVFRRALLMNFAHTVAIRRVICVYKDWIQMNVPELPIFMLEPDEVSPTPPSALDSAPKSRLRTDSYYGALGAGNNNLALSEELSSSSHLRAGGQNVLQVFFCNSAAVFLLFQIPKHEPAAAFLEEQVDICKRVLNIYRYAVMNTRMSPATWERLLLVLLHVTQRLLAPVSNGVSGANAKHSHFGIKNPDSLGAKLASALFQTLIVSWVKASLNVAIVTELWDRLQCVLSQLTFCDDLVTEWSKTMETLTRVLSRHVYNLDLSALPLDRLSEQKAKKKRQGAGHGAGGPSNSNSASATAPSAPHIPLQNLNLKRAGPSELKPRSSSSERKSLIFSPPTPSSSKRKLKRALSDGNLNLPPKALNLSENESSTDADRHSVSLMVTSEGHGHGQSQGVEERLRKKSRSMESLRTLKIATHFGHIGQPGALNPDWAEISSSTTSLGNASTIHIDDGNSIDCSDTSKSEIRGVISGGNVKGWLPSVAAILWRRMLGILGNVNDFPSPKTHAHFFGVLQGLWDTLAKVADNQGVSLDNLSTPKPPEMTPPLTFFSGWCFEAFDLPEEFYAGKVLAVGLLCDATLAAAPGVDLSQEYLTKFVATLHKAIISKHQEMINEIVRRCGLRYISKMLPGFSLLLLDLSQAAHSVLSSPELTKAPRPEAAAILGAALTLAELAKELPILKPNSIAFVPVTSHPTHEVVLSCLLEFSKCEPSARARVICLQGLAIYLARELNALRSGSGGQGHGHGQLRGDKAGKIVSIVQVLLASVKVANRSVALVASDLFLLLADYAPEFQAHFPQLVPKIILGLKWSLQAALPLKNSSWASGRPVEGEKRLCISLLLTLGEWVMGVGLQGLLTPTAPSSSSPTLLSSVFEVLDMASKGYQLPGVNDPSMSYTPQDFDPNVPFDDLQTTENSSKNEKNSSFSKSEPLPGSLELETVKLAAKNLLHHLVTQLSHFPMSSDASRCGSVVSEHEDVSMSSGAGADDELSAYIFSLPNLQMFALNDSTLLSILELKGPGAGDTDNSPFPSSSSVVRLILRDLSGKACWDAVQLHSPQSEDGGENWSNISEQLLLEQQQASEEAFYLSTVTGNFLPQLGPRLTLRKRAPGVLPTVDNSAEDLDNLDDLLSYLGVTSPEVLQRVGQPLNVPWSPPCSISRDNEDDVVSALVNQRNVELEFLLKFDGDLLMKPPPVSSRDSYTHSQNNSEDNLNLNNSGLGPNYALSRRVFSQLGLMGWEQRDRIQLLAKDERLLRELKHLDGQRCRESHKLAVIYVAEGQEDKASILSNSGGSEVYEEFVSGLGWEVELESHTGFLGGLARNGSTGETAPYFATSFTEVIFHVATRMPSASDDALLAKTRHLGNDEVHIVWSEHWRDYRSTIIPTEFCDVLIVIYPLKFGLFRVSIHRKPEIPYFGPLYNEAVVERDLLPSLVRATAINASRAKRSALPFYMHHFEERSKSLGTIIRNYRSRSSFEHFASSVYSPLLPPPTFPQGVSNRSSVASFSRTIPASSTTSSASQLSTALALDSTTGSGVGVVGRRPTYDIPFSFNPGPGSSRSSGMESPSPQPQPPPNLPPKKLAAKLGSALKPKLHTPPASPQPPQ